MIRNRIFNYTVYINYLLKDKCTFLQAIQNSSKILLSNLYRIRTFEIERLISQNFKHKFNENKSKYSHGAVRFLLGATILSFAEDKISDEEINEHIEEFFKESPVKKIETAAINNGYEDITIKSNTIPVDSSHLHITAESSFTKSEFPKMSTDKYENFVDSSWTQLINSRTVKLWRKPLQSNPKVYEYRLCGTFDDISARSFYVVQTDVEYRKQWDDLIVDLNIIKTDKATETDTIRWITHYPYPMSDREYIFKRRSCVLQNNRSAFIVSKAIKEESIPHGKSSSVRIVDYKSLMYIQSHSTFDKVGMDYFLIYYDDPKTNFPSAAVSWMSTAGIPSFMEKVHKASLALEENLNEEFVEDFEIQAPSDFTRTSHQEKPSVDSQDERHYSLYTEAFAFNLQPNEDNLTNAQTRQ